ncbi:MAG: hypothetical protein CMJ48_12505 [Planctomycetaceae bacterium]|nr:hypothetical protein [Planctomycetaceae bacterium]
MPLEIQSTDVLLSTWSDDEDMLGLLEMFVGALPERIAAIEQALEQEDLPALASLSHQMKGSAGGYGFPAITAAAAELEDGVKAGSELTTLVQKTRELTELCARVRVRADSV